MMVCKSTIKINSGLSSAHCTNYKHGNRILKLLFAYIIDGKTKNYLIAAPKTTEM